MPAHAACGTSRSPVGAAHSEGTSTVRTYRGGRRERAATKRVEAIHTDKIKCDCDQYIRPFGTFWWASAWGRTAPGVYICCGTMVYGEEGAALGTARRSLLLALCCDYWIMSNGGPLSVPVIQ